MHPVLILLIFCVIGGIIGGLVWYFTKKSDKDKMSTLNTLFYGTGTPDAPNGNSLKSYILNSDWAISTDATKYSPAISYGPGASNIHTRDLTIGTTTTNYPDKTSAYAAVLKSINDQNKLTGTKDELK